MIHFTGRESPCEEGLLTQELPGFDKRILMDYILYPLANVKKYVD